MSHVTATTMTLAATVTRHVASVTDDTSMGSVWAGIGLTDLFFFFHNKTLFFLVSTIHLKGGENVSHVTPTNYRPRRDRYEPCGVCDK